MSRREQLRKIRKQLEGLHGDPIANAIGKVMDECEANAWGSETHMTREELEAAEKDTAELLELLEGAKPAPIRGNHHTGSNS